MPVLNFKKIFLHPRGLPRLARVIKYTLLDIKYGSWYLGAKLRYMGLGDDKKGWHGASSSDYDALEIMFSEICVKEEDVIVDMGCGRGRVFNYLLNKGYKNKLVGIDVDPALIAFTQKRLKKFKQVQLLMANIEDNPALLSGTIFYLFNPFTDRIVKKCADVLINKIKNGDFSERNRPIIIYYNCFDRLYIFEENPLWKIKKLGIVSHTQLEAAIIEPNNEQ